MLYLVKITEFFISPSSSCYNVYLFCFQFSLTKGYPEIYKSVIWVNIILCMFAYHANIRFYFHKISKFIDIYLSVYNDFCTVLIKEN